MALAALKYCEWLQVDDELTELVINLLAKNADRKEELESLGDDVDDDDAEEVGERVGE